MENCNNNKDTTNRLKNIQAKFDEEMLNINESIQTYIHWKHLIFENDELRHENTELKEKTGFWEILKLSVANLVNLTQN